MTPEEKVADLGRMAKAEHDDIVLGETMVRNATIRAGRHLTQAKRMLAHGRWLPWLRMIGIPERSARWYIEESQRKSKTPKKLNADSSTGELRQTLGKSAMGIADLPSSGHNHPPLTASASPRKQRGVPSWKLPGRRLIQTCNMFNAFLEYAGDMLVNMPVDVDNALQNPSTPQEENHRLGLVETLRGIQKIANLLEKKYVQAQIKGVPNTTQEIS